MDNVCAELPREVRSLVFFSGRIIGFECPPGPVGSQSNGEFEVFVDLEIGDQVAFPFNGTMIRHVASCVSGGTKGASRLGGITSLLRFMSELVRLRHRVSLELDFRPLFGEIDLL